MEDNISHAVNVTALAVPDPRPSIFGTPTSRVGFPSTARPSRTADPKLEPAAEVEPAPECGCTTSSGGDSYQLPLPPMGGEDMLQLLLRPKVAQYRENRRMTNKKPYNEYPKGAVLELSDGDEEEVRMHESLSALSTEDEKSKRGPMTVLELDEKMEKRTRDEIELRLKEANELHAMKMAAIQDEMERLRMEAAQRHAYLMAHNQQFLAQSQQFMTMMASLQGRPLVAYGAPEVTFSMATALMPPPPSSCHAVYIPEHALLPPALPVPEPFSRHVSAISLDLRLRVRISPDQPSIHSPPQEAHTPPTDPATATETAQNAVSVGDDTTRYTESVDKP